MTIDRVREVIGKYQIEFPASTAGKVPDEWELHVNMNDATPMRRHIAYMLVEMGKMCDEVEAGAKGREPKMMRWLGFIQGVLWSSGLKTLATLKSENMPKEEGGI